MEEAAQQLLQLVGAGRVQPRAGGRASEGEAAVAGARPSSAAEGGQVTATQEAPAAAGGASNPNLNQNPNPNPNPNPTPTSFPAGRGGGRGQRVGR